MISAIAYCRRNTGNCAYHGNVIGYFNNKHSEKTFRKIRQNTKDMTIRKRQLAFLLLVTIFLSSCEKETYVYYYLDNQSSSEVVVDGYDIIHSVAVDHTIPLNEKRNITHWSKRGLQTEFFEPTIMFGNDLVITNSSGDTLQKDYKILSNWQSSVDDKRKTASHDYILVVTDADF